MTLSKTMKALLDGHALNAAKIALAVREHDRYEELCSCGRFPFAMDLVGFISDMALAVTTFEQTKGLGVWDSTSANLDWEEACEAFVDLVIAQILDAGTAADLNKAFYAVAAPIKEDPLT